MALLSIFFGAAFTLASCYALGALLLRRTPAPPEIALGLGAVAQSLIIFVLLLLNLGDWRVFLVVGAVPLVVLARYKWQPLPYGRGSLGLLILLPYFVWYFVNALAPETIADGITYHLGLPAEYMRLGGFPDHVTFYGMVPQGMEMLYTMAFAFGRHSAAKLVEFTFFVATVPLIFRVGRRLGMNDLACLVAAVFYFCAPVVGLTGSCSYNDAAAVFFLLAALYVLLPTAPSKLASAPNPATAPSNLAGAASSSGAANSGCDPAFRPDQPAESRLALLAAGALAGFCYAIKLPGILVPTVAVLYFALHRRLKSAALLAAGAAIVIAPWMIRAAIVAGNPTAPLLNSVFPNPYFHIATEAELAANLRSLGQVTPSHVPWELAFGDHLTGTFGPLFFALPIGLLALRRREGRLLWAVAAIFALPWLTNTGARFLMPSVMLGALALGMVLPRPAAWAAIAIQAVLCWPQVIDKWETRYAFRLHEFPLAAALRIEPEPEYLRRHLPEYNVVQMIQKSTLANARILALTSLATAYLDRDVSVTWQSAEADQLLDTLRLASVYSTTPSFDWTATWPEQAVRVLRFRIPVTYDGEWDINEVQLYSSGYRVFNSPQWSLNGWPNRWECPLAFDGNLATRWRTWETVRAGMYLEVNLENPQRLTSAVLLTHTPVFRVPLEIYGQDVKGAWHLLTNSAQAIPRPPQDLRLEAVRAIRKAGFRYVLVPTGSGGNTPIGSVIVGHDAEWGLERVGYAGDFHLFRVK